MIEITEDERRADIVRAMNIMEMLRYSESSSYIVTRDIFVPPPEFWPQRIQ